MTTLIIFTILAIFGVVLSCYLAGNDNHLYIPVGIVSVFTLIICIGVSLMSSMRDDIVKVFPTSELTIETTPYRVVVTKRQSPYNEFVWKDAYTVARAKYITHLRIVTPVNAWGITLDKVATVQLLFSDSAAPEGSTR